ncbi:MAG: hypothetical protein GWP09_03130 [Nitrospiraceae bacterium]|nr:hypothetical protein [Nitrospiraceae bacterium]
MLHLRCSNCGYRFTTKKDKIPLVCPYCGAKNTLEVEKGAQDLLNE